MKYFVKKILQAIVTLFLVSLVVFIAVRSSGDPTTSILESPFQVNVL